MFKVGQMVRIKNKGDQYTNYPKWPGLEGVKHGYTGKILAENDEIGIVLSKAPHEKPEYGGMLYLVRTTRGDFILDEVGLTIFGFSDLHMFIMNS